MNSPLALMKCRVCLGEYPADTMTGLFVGEEPLSEQLELCAGIKIRQCDSLPASACSNCCEFPRIWSSFRQMCLNSQVFWESSCSRAERPHDMMEATDGEYMKFLYDSLQLLSADGEFFPEEDPFSLEEEEDPSSLEAELLDTSSQSQEMIDVNDLIMGEGGAMVEQDQDELYGGAMVSELDGYENASEIEERLDLGCQTPAEASLLTDDPYEELDFEEEERIHEPDFLSSSPSPEPTSSSDVKRKPGRPRKQDHELKFKRKEKTKRKPGTGTAKEMPPMNFVCSICGNIYDKRSSFTAHMMGHTDYKPHQCEICLKSFRQMGELRAHIRRHTGERPYQCKHCERRFYDRSERVRHERVHTNTRPFACKECGKTFTHTAILKNHILVHSGEKNYSCDICCKSFALLHQLKAHLQTITHRSKVEQSLASTSDYMPG
ncbi:hypothetical protein KR018_009858 [Drosophila ironensis]|nr:hypothetical protein KR018_009858 [Drosophila ironensis]